MPAAAAQQRDVEFTCGDAEYIGGTPFELTDESTAIDREFCDLSRTGKGNSSTTRSNIPLVTGDQAHPREFCEQAYELAAEPKQLVTVPAAAHIDLCVRVDLIPFDVLPAFSRTA